MFLSLALSRFSGIVVQTQREYIHRWMATRTYWIECGDCLLLQFFLLIPRKSFREIYIGANLLLVQVQHLFPTSIPSFMDYVNRRLLYFFTFSVLSFVKALNQSHMPRVHTPRNYLFHNLRENLIPIIPWLTEKSWMCLHVFLFSNLFYYTSSPILPLHLNYFDCYCY